MTDFDSLEYYSMNLNMSLFLLLLLCGWGYISYADESDLKASLAYLPKILESPEKGAFVDLVKAIDSIYEGKIDIVVYPFPRSLHNIISGERDFHLPMIRNRLVDESSLPYRYASEVMGEVVFVIYSHQDKPITLNHINEAKQLDQFPYRIDTMRGLVSYFEFKVKGLSSIESGMRRVSKKRIDAFIFAQEESDFILEQLKITNIHRAFYTSFEDVIVIPKGKKGEKIDNIISQSIRQLKSDNIWQLLHLKVHRPYQNWQPYEVR